MSKQEMICKYCKNPLEKVRVMAHPSGYVCLECKHQRQNKKSAEYRTKHKLAIKKSNSIIKLS